jgi:hypothetical protein
MHGDDFQPSSNKVDSNRTSRHLRTWRWMIRQPGGEGQLSPYFLMTRLSNARIEKRDSFFRKFSTVQKMAADRLGTLLGQRI